MKLFRLLVLFIGLVAFALPVYADGFSLTEEQQIHQIVKQWLANGKTFGTAGTGGHIIQDEGTPTTEEDTLNFTGGGITCTVVADVITCDVPAGSVDEAADYAWTGDQDFSGATVTLGADQVSVDSTNLDGTALTVQGSLEEIETQLDNHITDATAAHAATAISVTPAGNIAATEVGTALNELDTEKQPVDADLTALAGNSTAGFWAAATNAARSLATASTNNITITNPAGVAGNPTFDVGPNVALTTRSFTATTGDWDLGLASSFKFPATAGAAPTASGRCAYDTTANAFKCGVNGSTITLPALAAVQPIHINLTALSGLAGVAASIPRFTGAGTMSILALPTCTDTGGNHWNFDGTSITCGTSSTGGLSGMTAGKIQKALTETTIGDSVISESGGDVTVGGGLVVGTTPFLIFDTSAIATSDKTWTILNFSGTIRPSTGALTPGNVVTTDANGLLVDGGAAGAGTWTDSSSNTGSNKTLDESSNTLKITKSVQVELFGPTSDTTSGNGQYYFRVPVSLNGTNLIGIQTNTVTAGTTGLTSVQITRCAAVATSPLCSGTADSMLSTVVSIDSGETSSSTAATAAVIDTTKDDLATGQILRFDVTAIHTTPAKGLIVNLDFKLP